MAPHFLPQQQELFILHLAGTFVRPQDGILHLLELRGDEAFRIHQRLLALVVGRHLVVMALGYFNVVAENVVEADFQGINARPPALLLLELGQPLLPVAGSQAQLIQPGVVPFPDDAALLDRHGRLIHQGALEQVHQLVKAAHAGADAFQHFPASGQGFQIIPERGNAPQGGSQRLEVTGVPRALGNAARQPFHVPDVFQALPQLAHQVGFLQKNGDHLLPRLELFQVAQGVEQPVPELARAHRGARPVQGAQQGKLHAAAGIHQVQVPLAGLVNQHGALRGAHGNTAQMVRGAAELVAQVMKHRARRPQSGGHLPAAETVQGMHPEVAQQIGNGRGRQERIPVVIKRGMGAGEAVRLLVADQKFGRIDAGQLVQKQVHVLKLGHGKFPRGVVHACQAEMLFILIKSHDVIVAGGIQQIHIRQGSGGNHAGQLPLHQLARLRNGGLLRNRHALPSLHQAANIPFRAVVRHPAHRNAVALGQRQAQNGGSLLGVLKEHLIKIPQPEKQQDVLRQALLHAKVLIHHRGGGRSGITHK